MQKYELCILLVTICVTGVAFNIKITDLTILRRFKVKKVDINFRSANIFMKIKKMLKKVAKTLTKSLIYMKKKSKK